MRKTLLSAATGVFSWFMTSLSFLLFFGVLGLSLWASWRVKAVYAKYSQVPASSGMTGAETAARILAASGIYDVQIYEGNQPMGDHYDPLNKRLILSSQNFRGTSTAALGVAAHECGHAVQHKMAYAPLNWRMAAVGMTTFASQVVFWLPLVGMFTGILSRYTGLMIMAVAWGIIMLFNLITLPVEFDASARAKRILTQMGFIRGGGEAGAVNSVLNAAAWTYVAAFVMSLVYLLWFLLPLLGGRRN
jgi:Zn-dependent membrane protease YugP